MHKSVATLDSPEFINLQPLDINPLMSKCEIKVLYTGNNRNRSSISKEVAAEMSKTLRGAPIVGYYKENKEDFGDHGGKITIDDEQFVMLVAFDKLAYDRKYNAKAVKKTLSIPAWLNNMAMEQNINFSNVLQKALMNELGLNR